VSRRLVPNLAAGVHVGWFVAAALLGSAWLGLPVWAWPGPVLALYVLHVRLAPMAPCRWCGGEKKVKTGKGTRSWRPCRWCGGKGDRVRWGWLRRREGGGGGGLSF
jgi:hypothetical protein